MSSLDFATIRALFQTWPMEPRFFEMYDIFQLKSFRQFQGTMFNLYAKITSYQLHLETCFIPNK